MSCRRTCIPRFQLGFQTRNLNLLECCTQLPGELQFPDSRAVTLLGAREYRDKPLQTQFLRISVTDASLSQMLYQPDCEPNAGHGLILMFPNAAIADQNAQPLANGLLCLRIRPEAVSPFTLSMLTCLLHPFKGHFGLNVNGTFETDAGGTTTVLAESVTACNIQPTVPS